MEELTLEQQENIRKREELEHAVMFNSPDEVSKTLKTLGKVDMSARALCYALRFRGVEWIKALVECGATFDYDREAVKLPDNPYIWYIVDFSLGLLRFSETIKRAFYSQGHLHDWCFPDPYNENGITYEVLPLEERLKCFDYLVTVADKVSFDPQWFFYNAVLSNNMDMVKALRERGMDLPEQKKVMVTKPDKETANDWYEFAWHLGLMSDDEFCSVADCLLELTDADVLKYTDGIYYDIMRHRFGNPDFFKFIITNFDQKKMNKTMIMREIVKRDAIPCLPVCEEVGWLAMNRRRDEIIKFAAENDKTEAVAWLMDFKNRTADLSAEREKAEKKIMRELNADPNSVGELKKIWTYKKQEDGTLIITSYKGSSTTVTIPEKIGKDTVTAIGEYALSPANSRATEQHRQIRKKITKIIIPDTVKRIEANAFSLCASLMEINIPHGIIEIAPNLFDNCKSLKAVTIPDSVTLIGSHAFYRCMTLTSVNVPGKVTEIGWAAFCQCEKLKSIELPESVNFIDKYAFADCKSLERIKIPNGVAEIYTRTFGNCIMLQSVEIPDTVETIGDYAFYDCGSLKRVELPNSVQNIKIYAFGKCGTLETITLPPSIKQIKNQTRSGEKPETIFDESPDVTAIVEPKSYAERYCKRNEIPYKYVEK